MGEEVVASISPVATYEMPAKFVDENGYKTHAVVYRYELPELRGMRRVDKQYIALPDAVWTRVTTKDVFAGPLLPDTPSTLYVVAIYNNQFAPSGRGPVLDVRYKKSPAGQ